EETAVVQEENSDLGGFKGLVAHWKFDGDLKDASQFANEGEAVGGKTGITYVDAVAGKGVKLDGKSYIKVKNSASLNLCDSFTFSFWVYKEDMRKNDDMEGGVPYIIKNNDEYCDIPYGMYEWWKMTPGIVYADSDGAKDIHAQKRVDIRKWTLISATYDGETMKIYHNKELVKSELQSGALINSAQPLYIGFGHFMNVDNYFKGILDDMRIYNTALSYTDIEDLYDGVASKTPGKDLISKPNKLVAYYKFEDTLKDLSGFKNDGTAIKASNFKYVDGIAGKGVKFNGASYIAVKDNASLDLDKGFTFGAWIYREKSTKNQPIFSKYGSSENKKACSYQLTNWTGIIPLLALSDFEKEGETTEFYPEESIETADGKWFYYTATYNGKFSEDESGNAASENINSDDINNVKIYINGKLVKTEEFEGDLSNSSGPLWIGGTTDSTYFKGIMDEFRIYNYGLSPTDVIKLYNMRDGIEATGKDNKVILSSLGQKQNVPLKVNLLTHKYTSPGINAPGGKEELIKLDITTKAAYKSNNTKVATVSANGIITTIGKGKAEITVTYNKYSKIIPVVVK
ncbi:MAG: Ig-like protein, partial [Eubacterium sp.]|nr:Ig-like protein [Eubacterium sp.]